jgi:23S rRNA (adenine2030-N6)-methyltransferase
MLSYQHGYHAGNFADVMKHLTLVSILRYLVQKDKPIFYLETHAGKGLYDLTSAESMKTGEATQGIEQLWPSLGQLPAVFAPYLDSIRACNPQGTLRYYPGSPLLALDQLRSNDRIFCCELHPREFTELQKITSKRRGMKMHVSHTDGLAQLSILLPPPERRGLVFIDPSYEIKSDYQQIPKAVREALSKFHTGVYCIWYPIVDKHWHQQFLKNMQQIREPQMRVEFHLKNSSAPGMTGCGMWVVNPPYVLANELKTAMATLVKILNPGHSSYEIHTA